jgi:hypothetical protein
VNRKQVRDGMKKTVTIPVPASFIEDHAGHGGDFAEPCIGETTMYPPPATFTQLGNG